MVLEIGGEKIEPNTKSYFQLRVAKLLDGSELKIPLHVIHGKKDGPVLGLSSSVHGQEYYQNRVVRRIVKETEPDELNGTILAVPVANPLAFSHRTRSTPHASDFANLNRVFPGKRLVPLFGSLEPTDISLTMKMAATLTNEWIEKCDYIIDFHGMVRGGCLKKMLYNETQEAEELARIFGLGIIHKPIKDQNSKSAVKKGKALSDHAKTLGIPTILPEIGGPNYSESFERKIESMGVRGVRNVMAHLKMVKEEIVLPDKQFFFTRAPHIRPTNSGYLISYMEKEDVGIGRPTREVRKGEVLGSIYDPYSLEELEQLKSPVDGLLYMCTGSCLVDAYEGGIAGIADYEGSKWIE